MLFQPILPYKLSIFVFGGSTNQNYMSYFLETYCLLKYEASPELRAAILDNWLLNMSGLPGKCKEGDLMQEHKNRFLEEAVQKCGGEFDDVFFRKTISPNVDHFLHIKEQLSTTMGLDQRSKTHTSRELDAELRVLLATYKNEELHLFRSKRTMGHASKNLFNEGIKILNGGKLKTFLKKSLAHADFVRKVVEQQNLHSSSNGDHISGTSNQVPTSMVGDDAEDTNVEGAHDDHTAAVDEDDTPGELDDSERHLTSGSYGAAYLNEDGEMIYGDTEDQGQFVDYRSDSDTEVIDTEMGGTASDDEEAWLSDVIPDADTDIDMMNEVQD